MVGRPPSTCHRPCLSPFSANLIAGEWSTGAGQGEGNGSLTQIPRPGHPGRDLAWTGRQPGQDERRPDRGQTGSAWDGDNMMAVPLKVSQPEHDIFPMVILIARCLILFLDLDTVYRYHR